MPSTSSHAADRRARLDRLDSLSRTLDTRFRLPVVGIRVGWDSILGLVPGVGDLATAIPGAVMIYEAGRMGARKRTLARMGLNTGIDFAVGGIPLVGDTFDLFFKSHRRNVALLRRELNRLETLESEERPWRKDTDRKTGRATARRSSDRKAASRSRDDVAARSTATSPARTKPSAQPNARRARHG
jgi:hypothetical protein